MSKTPGFRFYVEDDAGRRSLEYGVSTAKKTGDVYVSLGRGNNTKISIHASGEVNWSLMYEQLPNAPYVPDTGRHLARWREQQGVGAMLPLFIWIASEDLRAGEPTPTSSAKRLAAAGPGRATQVTFVLTPPIPGPITSVRPSPLWAAHLPNQRFLLLQHEDVEAEHDPTGQLVATRHTAWEKFEAEGKTGGHALCRVTSREGIHGMVEFTPARAPLVLRRDPREWVPGKPGRPRI